MSIDAEEKTLLDLDDDLLRAVAKELAKSALASAVALKRCSSRLKDLAAPLVADAVAMTRKKWRDAAAKCGTSGAIITNALNLNEVLKSIDLRGNSLGTEGWCAIFAALRDNKENKIESWNLSRQGINAEVAKVLAEYVSLSGVLENIDLRHNILGGEGKGVIRDAVSGREGFKLEM